MTFSTQVSLFPAGTFFSDKVGFFLFPISKIMVFLIILKWANYPFGYKLSSKYINNTLKRRNYNNNLRRVYWIKYCLCTSHSLCRIAPTSQSEIQSGSLIILSSIMVQILYRCTLTHWIINFYTFIFLCWTALH